MPKVLVTVILLLSPFQFAMPQNADPSLSSSDPASTSVFEAHRRLFDDRGRENLVDRANRLGDVSVVSETGMPFFPDGNVPPLEMLINNMACSADAISLVSVKEARPSLSQRQTWVFTNYIVTVDQVIKDDKLHHLEEGKNIVIARSGGEIGTPAGHRIRVQDASFPEFRVGSRYLVFLQHVPQSGQYATLDSRGGIRVFGQQLKPLTSDSGLAELGTAHNLSSLTSAIQAADCGETGGKK